MDPDNIISFPISEGKKKGTLLELTRTPKGVRARFEGNAQWWQIRTRYVNPQCLTLWLSDYGKPGDIDMHPMVWEELLNKVHNFRPEYKTRKLA